MVDRPTVPDPAGVQGRAADAFVERTQQCGLQARITVVRAADSFPIHLRALLKVIDGAHSIPNEVSGRALTQESEQVTDQRVLEGRRKQRIELFSRRGPILPSLPVSNRVKGQYH